MQHNEVIPIQSQEARVKAINRVCSVITFFAIFDVLVYGYLKLYSLVIILSLVAILFGALLHLNKRGYYNVSRSVLIIITNLGVISFSAYLGFRTGIYLYLFAAPMLTYMLFDFKQRVLIYTCFISYVLTFIGSYLIDAAHLFEPIITDEHTITLLFSVNIIFSFILCFVLIIYFSANNSNYISLLIKSNISISEQQDQLKTEISEKNEVNIKLHETLKDKEILLSEIHHRVKNNLAVVSGLIELQNYFVKDNVASSILLDSKNRIKTISLLHEKLYGNKNYERIDAKEYISDLIKFIEETYVKPNQEIKIHLNIENIEIGIEEGVPFSLLLSELFTNSYKHAFIGRAKGNIYVNLNLDNSNIYFLEYIDDGVGFELNSSTKKDSLGLNLLEAFSTQLKSVGEFTSSPNTGVSFKIKFSVKVN